MLKKHLDKLLEESFAIGSTRVKDVYDAINFWSKLC